LRRRQHVEFDDETAATIEDPADDPEVALQHGQIIDLVYYHGKSVREVAEIVGIPEPTVKTRMFYARKRLAEQIKAA
jgi:RNA polymerase sigma-70 factor, ECF subfamily